MPKGPYVRKAVIPAAGLGTRLLPLSKEVPKEMLPLLIRNRSGETEIKPILQQIFDNLFDVGFRDFSFIVGRSKRMVEDYFTPDADYLEQLRRNHRPDLVGSLEGFYERIGGSSLVFVNQPQAKGFGDAVLRAKTTTGDEPFLLHAGDDLIVSSGNSHIRRLLAKFEEHHADVALFLERIPNPRDYGVVSGEGLEPGVVRIREIEEKPQKPKSDLAIIAIYAFKPCIYEALEGVKPDAKGEIQLTEAIIRLLQGGKAIIGVELGAGERRLDVGTPEKYYNSIRALYSLGG